MPELPEVETVVRTLSPRLTGCFIQNVTLFHQPSLHADSLPLSLVSGLYVNNISRRGKLIKLELLNPAMQEKAMPVFLFFHLRMTGKLLLGEASTPVSKHCRCLFDLKNNSGDEIRLFFEDIRTFGKILAGTVNNLEKWNFWNHLGPEPLEMRPQDLLPRLKSSRPIKNVLLDQGVIAGIGNIYADESLFKAGVSPLRPASSLNERESVILMRSIQDTLRLAIENGGSSIRDYVDANGKSGSFQNLFAVYGRGSKNCINCGTQLEKIRLGGRATVFCPVCQK